jgi:site-specific recombinase XerD
LAASATGTTTATAYELEMQGVNYTNFIDGIRSPASKKGYRNSIARYCRYLKLTNVDDLMLHSSNPKLIEEQIKGYIKSLERDGVSYATRKFLIAPIFSFYHLNDVLLNRRRVSRYLGEFNRVVKDSAYTTEQIQQMLQNADQRLRCIILILCSTGCRIGAIPNLTLGNLTKIPDYNLYKIVFYQGTNNEYYTFCTREAATTGIENYLNYRKRLGKDQGKPLI